MFSKYEVSDFHINGDSIFTILRPTPLTVLIFLHDVGRLYAFLSKSMKRSIFGGLEIII